VRAPKLDVIESSSSIQDLASIEARKVAPPKTSKSASERASGEKVEPPGEQSQPHPANSSARPHLRSALGAVGRRARAAYRVDERREARQIKWTGNRNIGSIWAGNKRCEERRGERIDRAQTRRARHGQGNSCEPFSRCKLNFGRPIKFLARAQIELSRPSEISLWREINQAEKFAPAYPI